MKPLKKKTLPVKYSLNAKGRFTIENYNQSKLFSNFFPGIAGLLGIPMWVFYVNRGQCISSFGIESKSKAIMEFQPANKSYRLTSLQGFRTFIKVKSRSKEIYWEPFQSYLPGTDFRKKQSLSVSAHDLVLEETNSDLGLNIQVRYFTIPEEPFAGLVREVTIKNTSSKNCDIEIIDGLPAINPYGLTDDLNKNISRTVEAWVKVSRVKERSPYYQLTVKVSDKPEVTPIKEGNFFISFNKGSDGKELLPVIIEASSVFGSQSDFSAPEKFLSGRFQIPQDQYASNRTPCAMSHSQFVLKTKSEQTVVSLFGYAHSEQELSRITELVTKTNYIEEKARRNEEIVSGIKNYAFTRSSSNAFNMYAGHTFLDNILRGGLPITVQRGAAKVSFNVYSRKHGDLERDYNFFTLTPTFYSQGNGNYRDVNQNRRNDVYFNPNVGDSHLINFLNLVQADGYNPLVVRGTTFSVINQDKVDAVLKECLGHGQHSSLTDLLKKNFLPGDLLESIYTHGIQLKIPADEFLARILEHCDKQETADHGEGFWTDHWTYNLDLIESYLSVYPEKLNEILLDKKVFSFYLNSHYVLPRDQKYFLTKRGVRQYHSVYEGGHDPHAARVGHKLRVKQGEGAVYQTQLITKLLCMIANKVSSLDPSGVGVEMEADKPNWYDSLNGLPGLLGSSISETLEIKRFALFLQESLRKLSISDDAKISLFEELATFVSGLSNVLSLDSDPLSYWNKSNDVKEHYRSRIRRGIDGQEKALSVGEIKNFLNLVVKKVSKAQDSARNENGNLVTYFFHEVTEYEKSDKQGKDSSHFVRPMKFKKHNLPLFLEGYVHALRVENTLEKAREIYKDARESALFDKKLKMYKVNAPLTSESAEIGRTRIFPPGWLENESIWLHMEYKFILELLKQGLYDEFYENFNNVLIPFLKPNQYGRNILENSSFIVSSAHEDQSLHGQGFVARLSGSTAEFLHMWLLMNVGKDPFEVNGKGELTLSFKPVLPGAMFAKNRSIVELGEGKDKQRIEIPAHSYAFMFLGKTLVVYHNPKHRDTFGPKKAVVKRVVITQDNDRQPTVINSSVIASIWADKIRSGVVHRIDIHLG